MVTQAEKERVVAQRLLDDYDEVSNGVSIADSDNDHRLPRTSLERNRSKLSYARDQRGTHVVGSHMVATLSLH